MTTNGFQEITYSQPIQQFGTILADPPLALHEPYREDGPGAQAFFHGIRPMTLDEILELSVSECFFASEPPLFVGSQCTRPRGPQGNEEVGVYL